MKTITKILTLFCLILLASCEKDNFDGPNAQFYGSIKDAQTGELVETELQNGSMIEVFELGYENPVSQKLLIKNNGEFRNNLVFANKYDVYLRNGNFYQQEFKGFVIKPGENEHHFEVVPYIRIKNAKITHDKANNKVMATFNLEGGKAEVQVKNIRLYAFSDIHVGESVKFDVKNSADRKENINQVINPATVYTLEIDLGKNPNLFKAGRDYFFRIGALANLSGQGTVRHNFAPYVKFVI